MKIKKIFVKYFTIIIAITIFLPSILAQTSDTNQKSIFQKNKSNVIETKSWTALYYLDVDWDSNNFDALEYWFIDEIASNENLNVIVIQDRENDPAYLYYIDENHNKILLEELGEINMGDYQTLKDFISFGKENYPANRYQLNIYNHGGAWMGACMDTTDNDQLIMDEFQQALSETGGVDILFWIGCCLMGSIETVYELTGLVDVSVGSEDLGFMDWWNNVFDDMCTIVRDDPYITTIELGKNIVEIIGDNPNPYSNYLTMSAIDVNKVPALVEAFNCLSKNLGKKWFREGFKKTKLAHDQTYQLAQIEQYAEMFEVYDLKEFVVNLDQNDFTVSVLNAFDEAVIIKRNGEDRVRTNGLSIFFPSWVSRYKLLNSYNNKDIAKNLDFPKDTIWNEFLNLFVITNVLFGRLLT
jgi:hypothetical protein